LADEEKRSALSTMSRLHLGLCRESTRSTSAVANIPYEYRQIRPTSLFFVTSAVLFSLRESVSERWNIRLFNDVWGDP
jgi:hypothetical protein